MTVADYTETAFARLPRLHHKDALVGPSSAGFGKRNLVGMMGVMMSSGAKAWTNPYVTDGLIAMWDGEWNSGGGVHDETTTTWTDLSGNSNDATAISSVNWGDDFSWKSSGFTVDKQIFAGVEEFRIECAWETSSAVNGYANAFGSSSNRNYGVNGIGRWDTNNLVYGAIGGVNLTWDYSGYGARQTSMSYKDGYGYLFRNTSQIARMEISASQLSSFAGQAKWYVATNNNNTAQNKVFSVRIYNRALTATEIAANYAVDKERFGLT